MASALPLAYSTTCRVPEQPRGALQAAHHQSISTPQYLFQPALPPPPESQLQSASPASMPPPNPQRQHLPHPSGQTAPPHPLLPFAGPLQPPDPVPNPPSQPPPVTPISESTNPDAIALRAAMSILQIQRQQALRDMQTLEVQKEKALGDVEGFVEALKKGHVRGREAGELRFVDGGGDEEMDGGEHDEEEEDGEEKMGAGNGVAMQGIIQGGEQIEAKDEVRANPAMSFGDIPTPQNVVRMPPINWAKYHIVGESLDKLHERERRMPTDGRPRTDEDVGKELKALQASRRRSGWGGKGDAVVVAAPYDPWRDQLPQTKKSTRTRSGGGKKGG
ncbi:MAG: hypothetical protein Q9163_002645 [Psora crenata]